MCKYIVYYEEHRFISFHFIYTLHTNRNDMMQCYSIQKPHHAIYHHSIQCIVFSINFVIVFHYKFSFILKFSGSVLIDWNIKYNVYLGKWLSSNNNCNSTSSTKWKWKWLFSIKCNHLHRLDYNIYTAYINALVYPLTHARTHVILHRHWNWIIRCITHHFYAIYKAIHILCAPYSAVNINTILWMVKLIMKNIIIVFISQDSRNIVKSLCRILGAHEMKRKGKSEKK